MITQNSNYGVFIQNPAIVYTSGDNRIYGNATDVSGTLTSFVTK
jgi:hypothetical protein